LAFIACTTAPQIQERDPNVVLLQLQSSFVKAELEPKMLPSNGASFQLALVGHTYPLLPFPDELNLLIDSINQRSPDALVLLGDVVCYNDLEEWEKLNHALHRLEMPFFIVPGNHDVNFYRERDLGILTNQGFAEERYLEQADARCRLLQHKEADFLLINLNDSLDKVAAYIDTMRAHLDQSSPNFVLSHQDLWATPLDVPDNPQSWSNKSFGVNDLAPKLEGFDAFISGDWNIFLQEGTREFFGEEISNIQVGMRVQGDPIYFTLLEVKDGEISTEAVSVSLSKDSKWPRK